MACPPCALPPPPLAAYSPCRFGVTSHYVWQHVDQLAVNLVMCVILVIAKLPEMMGVRLIGKKKQTKRVE